MKSWVVILKMPESGNLYVLAGNPRGGPGIALWPAKRSDTTVVKDAFGFDTEEEALAWMKTTAELSEQGERLMALCAPYEASKLQ